jgi:hypothetical protein
MLLSKNIRYNTLPNFQVTRNPEHMQTGVVEALHTLLRPEMVPSIEVWMRTASEDQKRAILRLARKANPQGFSGVQKFERQLPSLLRRGDTSGSVVDLPYQRERLDERKALYSNCDPNNNGYCSFAEIDAHFRYAYGFGEKEKMQMLHAFNACRNIGGKETGPAADYIERKEFRKFLQTVYRNLGGIVEEVASPTRSQLSRLMAKSESSGKVSAKPAGVTVDLPFQREREAERNKLFSECDPNGNRYASFAEIDAIFRKRYGFGEKEKMPMLRAYDACKNITGKETGNAADYIEHKEFRKFLELVMKNLKDAAIQGINVVGSSSLSKSASAPRM